MMVSWPLVLCLTFLICALAPAIRPLRDVRLTGLWLLLILWSVGL